MEEQGEATPLFTVDKSDYERTCGTCTKCCQGWLSGEAYEYVFTKNNPCHFLDDCGDRCTIYNMRPQICQDYKCEWLNQPVCFPLWMRPDKSNVIVTWREGEHKEQTLGYWTVRECGKQIDSNVLNWIIQTARQHGINVRYEINGMGYVIGTPEFEEYAREQLN